MKTVIASSDKNRIEERVAVHSLLKCGYSVEESDIIDGETGLIYDTLRKNKPRETGISEMSEFTPFTFTRLYLPLFYEKLQSGLIKDNLHKQIVSHIRLFYRNIKFHSPIKFIYSEIMR